MEWIKVEDRLPENGGLRSKRVLAAVKTMNGRKYVCDAYMGRIMFGDEFYWLYSDSTEAIETLGDRVTHWTPWPGPPEDDE